MKTTFYITVNNIKYVVKTRMLDNNTNYNMGISIHKHGQKTPEWGTVIKHTDDVRQIAVNVINSWNK